MSDPLDDLACRLAARLGLAPGLPLGSASMGKLGRAETIDADTTKAVLSVDSLPYHGQSWVLTAAAVPPAEGPKAPTVFPGNFPGLIQSDTLRWVFGILEWQVGNARYRAELDLPAGGLAITLACDSIRF